MFALILQILKNRKKYGHLCCSKEIKKGQVFSKSAILPTLYKDYNILLCPFSPL